MFQIIIKDLDTGEIKADKKIKCFIAGGCDENDNGVIVNAIAGTPAECVSALCAAEAAKKRVIEKPGDIAEALHEAGYGNISEYKAEIERLRQEVRDTDKMARNTIEQYRAKNEELENALKQSEDNYSRAFERLKAQQREIEQLKAENEKLEEDIDMIIKEQKDDCKFDIKQAKIDVLNKLRRRAWQGYQIGMYIVSTQEIDELIKEIEK